MEKKIILLGTAPSSMMLAPFASEEWEVWSCSPGTYGVPRCDVFFELHRWENAEWFSEGYKQFLRDFKGPVFMSEHVDEVPNCTVLPWKELTDKYGPYFFTSSLAWMCAMAMEAGATKIAFYGVDMAATTEYENQRLGCQYFACLARAQGIEVGVPPESDLLRPAPLYGVCENSHVWAKSRTRTMELNSRRGQLQKEIETKSHELSFVQGALDDQDYHLHSWIGGIDTMGREFTEPPLIPALMNAVPKKTNGVSAEEMVPFDDSPLPFVEKPAKKKRAPRKNARNI